MSKIKDTYQTIASPSEGIYKEKGSKFISHCFPVQDEEDIDQILDKVKSDHHKARHHCYAYRLGINGELFRFNDDGEPSGTAGRPILGQLKSFEVSDVLAIVVRYFGGTKLGASGLVNAYKESTKDALQHAKLIKKTLEQLYSIQCNYEDLPILMEAIKNAAVDISEKHFNKQAELIVSIPLSERDQKWNRIATQFIGFNAGREELKEREIEIREIELN